MVKKIVNILFENFDIKGEWDENLKEYHFPILEVISKLTDCENPQEYWNNIKNKEFTINSKFDSNNIEVVNCEELFRIVQQIPYPQAEPIKMWLARQGASRINEIVNPEIIIEKAQDYCQKQGGGDKNNLKLTA